MRFFILYRVFHSQEIAGIDSVLEQVPESLWEGKGKGGQGEERGKGKGEKGNRKEKYLACTKSGVLSPEPHKLGMVVQACNIAIQT